MKGIIYAGIVVPASERADDHGPDMVVVTEEANGHAIWFVSGEVGSELIDYFRLSGANGGRDRAIEFGVSEAKRRRKAEGRDSNGRKVVS